MRGTSKVFAVIAAVLALGCLVAATALAAGGDGSSSATAKPKHQKSSKAKSSFRIINATQKDVLRKGVQIKLTVKVRKPKHVKRLKKPVTVKIKGLSSTFDNPGFKTVAKPKTLKLRKSAKRTVALKLTGAGRKAVASCQGRTIRVQIGKVKKNIKLKRTGACGPQPVDLTQAANCDFIGQQTGSRCMLPFPDDYYTVADSSTLTGKRINFKDASMPKNVVDKPISAAPYNLNDGFSPGAGILVRVPGLDNAAAIAQTGAAPINHIGQYTGADQPIVVIDTTTGERWPIWTEIDSNATSPDNTVIEIHPAKNFDSKHRYVVAMRNLKTSDGSTIAAPEGFRYYRDSLPSSQAEINSRRSHFEDIFKTLKTAGIQRANLYLAWDFTVSSDDNIAQRMLSIRNDAFTSVLGDSNLSDGVVTGSAPAFTVTSVANDPNTELARRVQGTFTVPCYLTNACVAPAQFDLDSSGNPIRHGDYTANFDCIIPHSAVDDAGAAPARPSLYGHGLLGSASEVASSPQRTLSETHDMIQCATDEIGFASQDIPNTIGILQDLSKFPQLTDRTQQGLLNELFLGRLLDNPSGFASVNAFHRDPTAATTTPNGPIAPGDGTNITTIDTSKLYYNGNSQGGILGGALTAISPDFTRASLGVPAMNYSLLLPRSIDFDTYSAILYPSYPDEMTRPLDLGLIQMLWDRSEPNGYAHRMTSNPLPNTPAHKVLMDVAFGDHQVSDWAANVEAATIGAKAHDPVVYDGRWPGVDQLFGIPKLAPTDYPYSGSAIVYWDGGPIRPNPSPPLPPASQTLGTDAPPLGNVPNESGNDPHGLPRATPAEQQMVSDFLRPDNISQINDTCSGGPCFDFNFAGP